MRAVIEALADLVRVMPGASYVTVSTHDDGHCSIGIACSSDEAAIALAAQLEMPELMRVTAAKHDDTWMQSCQSTAKLGRGTASLSVTGPHRRLARAADPVAVAAAVAKATEARGAS